MEELVKYLSILICVYFIIKSFRDPLYLFFVYIILESYFFATIDLYSIPIKIIPKITLYLDDIPKIIILILIIKNWKYLVNTEYKKYLLIIISSFFILSILRISAYYNNLNIDAIKNQIRLLSVYFIPLFLFLFISEKNIDNFLNNLILITIFSLAIFYLEYFTDYEKIFKYGYYESRFYLETGLKRISIVNWRFLLGFQTLFLMIALYKKNFRFLFIWILIIITYFLSTYRASFLTIILISLYVFLFSVNPRSIFRKRIKILHVVLLSLVLIIIFIYFSDAYYLYAERVQSSFTELKYDEGSANVRITKSYLLIQNFLNDFLIFFLGSILSKTYNYLQELIGMDVGILDTIVTNGIIFSLIFIVILFLIYFNLKNEVPSSIVIKALLIGSIPVLFFNYELLLYLSEAFIPIYGYYLAEAKIIQSNKLQLN